MAAGVVPPQAGVTLRDLQPVGGLVPAEQQTEGFEQEWMKRLQGFGVSPDQIREWGAQRLRQGNLPQALGPAGDEQMQMEARHTLDNTRADAMWAMGMGLGGQQPPGPPAMPGMPTTAPSQNQPVVAGVGRARPDEMLPFQRNASWQPQLNVPPLQGGPTPEQIMAEREASLRPLVENFGGDKPNDWRARVGAGAVTGAGDGMPLEVPDAFKTPEAQARRERLHPRQLPLAERRKLRMAQKGIFPERDAMQRRIMEGIGAGPAGGGMPGGGGAPAGGNIFEDPMAAMGMAGFGQRGWDAGMQVREANDAAEANRLAAGEDEALDPLQRAFQGLGAVAELGAGDELSPAMQGVQRRLEDQILGAQGQDIPLRPISQDLWEQAEREAPGREEEWLRARGVTDEEIRMFPRRTWEQWGHQRFPLTTSIVKNIGEIGTAGANIGSNLRNRQLARPR